MKNLHRFLNFASPRVLPKTCPALSRDQAVLLSSWVSNRIPGRQGESKSRPFSAILVYLNYVCFGMCINDCCITWICNKSKLTFPNTCFSSCRSSSYSNFCACSDTQCQRFEKSWPCNVKRADHSYSREGLVGLPHIPCILVGTTWECERNMNRSKKSRTKPPTRLKKCHWFATSGKSQ